MPSSTGTRPTLTSSRSRRMASLSMGNPPELQSEVGAARLEAREIHGDVGVSELAELGDDPMVDVPLPQLPDLVGRDLQSRETIVMADPKLPEPERTQEFLGGVD